MKNKYYCGKCEHIGMYTGSYTHSEKLCKRYAAILKVDGNDVEKCVPCICETLEVENAALRERLSKAVELPFDHEYADFYIEPYFGEIKPSLVDDGAKVVIPMYVYFKFNSVEEAKTWLSKQQTGGEQ